MLSDETGAHRMKPRALAVAAAAVFVASSACGTHGLSFVQDKRVDITRPRERSKVSLPVRIDWTVKDFAIGPGSGYFGVLVDQAPPRSGKTLAWLFRGSDSCRGTSGKVFCQTPEYLAQRNAFQTTTTSFTVEQVTRLTGNEKRRQFHEVTVVLLDAQGRRVGEGAWSVQFEVPKTH